MDKPDLVFEDVDVLTKAKEKADDIELDIDKLMKVCIVAIKTAKEGAEKVPMWLPVTHEFTDTKLNKAHLVREDDTSPRGEIVKGNANAVRFRPYATGRFDAYEILSWLAAMIAEEEDNESD